MDVSTAGKHTRSVLAIVVLVGMLCSAGCAATNQGNSEETPVAVAVSPIRETVVVRETVLVTVPPQQATVIVRETVLVTPTTSPATPTITSTPSVIPPSATTIPTISFATATTAPTAIAATDTPVPTSVSAPPTIAPTVQAPAPTAAVPPDQAAAIDLYRSKGCPVCHTLTVAGATGSVGPTHNGIGTTALARIADPNYTGTATTAAEYIRESIVNPTIYATEGYSPNIMPSFANTSDQFLDQLVALLLAQK